jgi:hypothetical protein
MTIKEIMDIYKKKISVASGIKINFVTIYQNSLMLYDILHSQFIIWILILPAFKQLCTITLLIVTLLSLTTQNLQWLSFHYTPSSSTTRGLVVSRRGVAGRTRVWDRVPPRLWIGTHSLPETLTAHTRLRARGRVGKEGEGRELPHSP